MNTIIKILSTKKTVATYTNSQARTQCNYANNYYGDQVCVKVKSQRYTSHRATIITTRGVSACRNPIVLQYSARSCGYNQQGRKANTYPM